MYTKEYIELLPQTQQCNVIWRFLLVSGQRAGGKHPMGGHVYCVFWSLNIACRPTLLFTTVIKMMIRSHMGRKWFISAYRLQSIMKGSQGRNSRQEPGERTRAEHGKTLLTDLSPWLTQSTFLDNLGWPAQGGIACSGIGPPTSIINQKVTPTGFPTEQSDGAIFQLCFSLLRWP